MKARLKQRGVLESTCALRAPTLINQYEQRRGHRSDGTTRTIMRIVPSLSHPLTESEDEVLTFLLAGRRHAVACARARGGAKENEGRVMCRCHFHVVACAVGRRERWRRVTGVVVMSSLARGEGEEEGRARE